MIYNYKLELKRGPRHTSKISEPTKGGKASIKFVMPCCSEENKLGGRKESAFGKWIKYQKRGVNKQFENKTT